MEEMEESVWSDMWKNNKRDDRGKCVQDSCKTNTNVPAEKWTFKNAPWQENKVYRPRSQKCECYYRCAGSQLLLLLFSRFTLCRGEADLLVTAKYIFLHHLPFSDLSSHSPPILAVVFHVFWNLLASLSRLFSLVYHLSFWPCVQPIAWH